MVPKAIIVYVFLVAFAPSRTSASNVPNQCADGEECSQSPVLVQKKQIHEARALEANTEEEVEQSPRRNVKVCNISRVVDAPFHPHYTYAYLTDENDGGNKDYQTACKYLNSTVLKPGCGGLNEWAIAKCSGRDHPGCIVYRVFDEELKPHPEKKNTFYSATLGDAKACGHYYSPENEIQGKSLEQYFKDAGVCTNEYGPCSTRNKTYPGNKGGYLLKCTLRYDQVFTIGTTQSANCIPDKLPATSTIQMVVGNGNMNCMYCKGNKLNAAKCDDEPKNVTIVIGPGVCHR